MDSISLGAALRGSLLSARNTGRSLADVSLRLATGKRVNSALDQPQNFFAAESLNKRASDFVRVKTELQQSVLTIQEAASGIEALERLMDAAKAVANTSLILSAAGLPDPNIYTTGSPVNGPDLQTQILAQAPSAYWRLDEAAGGTAVSSAGGAPNGSYVGGPTLGQPALYPNGGGTTPNFNGVNQRVDIPDSGLINVGARPQRTVELVFNATTVAGRQVLYEEGATVNSLAIYIDSGRVYVEGVDQGAWGPLGINAPIVAGQTYHVAFVFDQPSNSFTGYLDGVQIGTGSVANQVFPSHTGNVAIGATADGLWFHDGPFNGNGFYFNGQISDVALYNTALTQPELLAHATSLNDVGGLEYHNFEFDKIMNEINRITLDASYAGVNLLGGDNLLTVLNDDRSSTLTTNGVDFTHDGLEIKKNDFLGVGAIKTIIQSVDDAIKEVQLYGSTLSADLQIINGRRELAARTIETHQAAADDLTLADLSQEGANLLALEIRQNLGAQAISLAAESQQTVLKIFASGQTSGVFS